MSIISVRYITPAHDRIHVEYDTGKFIEMDWPSGTWRDEGIYEWLADGGQISIYQDYYDWELIDTVNWKSEESEAYATALINAAYENPQQGVTAMAAQSQRRVASRRKNKADKQAGDITLTQEEKDQAKVDQKLSEYEGKCWTASDKVITNLYKETKPADVMAIDIVNNTNWPAWNPPI